MDSRTARRVLGLGPAADATDAERAFRRLAAVHHPDRGGDPDRFLELVASRDVLSVRGSTRPDVPVASRRPTVPPGQRVIFVSRPPLKRKILLLLRRVWERRVERRPHRRVR